MPFDPSTAKPVGQVDTSVFDPSTATPVKPSGALRRVADQGIKLAQGVVGVPEAAVGVADLVTGGQAGKLAESAGVRFKDAKDILGDYLSPEQKAADAEVQKAEGFLPTLGAMAKNPSTIIGSAVESAPSMLLGGAASRGLLAVAPRLGAIAAGAAGEGLTAAGQNAEQVRQEDPNGTLTGQQSAVLGASGVLTGGISLASGKLANKLGIGDVQTMLAGGKLGVVGEDAAKTAAQKGITRKLAEGFANEGVLQELPQSYQEQVAQNVAQGKPWDEGAAKAGAQGLMAGALMGGGANAAAHLAETKPVAAPEVTPPTLQIGNTPDPYISFTDGTVARQSEVDTYINSLPPDQQPAARAKIMGLAPQPSTPEAAPSAETGIPVTETTVAPVKPSEAMGLNPAAGPLSAAAVTAVDTGAHQEIQFNQASAADQAEYDRVAAEQDTTDKPITHGPIAEAAMSTEDKQAILFGNERVGDGGTKYEGTQDGDILNGLGKPYPTRFAAQRRARMEGKDWTIATVFDGFVARRGDARKGRETPVSGSSTTQAPAGAAAESAQNQAPSIAAPAQVATETVANIDDAAHQAATSPNNALLQPTDGQKEAGNYPKGHVNLNGLDLSIENPAGSVRSGKDKDGKAWINTLQHHYGYIKGTVGNDKDHFDLFIKPGTPLDFNGPVYVVDQIHPHNGKFDEHKALVGFSSVDEATAAYHANYAKDWKGMQNISSMMFSNFKTWVKDGPKNTALAAPTPAATTPKNPPFASKADTDHLFGVDQKRAKAIERIAKGTAYFGNGIKAQQFIAQNGLKDTHQAIKTSATRWDVKAKDSQPQGSTSGTQTAETIPPATQQQAPERAAGQSVEPVISGGVHMATGRADFAAGKPRTLPSYFTNPGDKNSKAWYSGWDAAKASAPAVWKSGSFAPVGERAFEAGKPRVLPQELQGIKNSEIAKEWYSGWDAANVAAPVRNTQTANAPEIKPTKAFIVPKRGPDGGVQYAAETVTPAPATPVSKTETAAKPDALSDKEKAAKAKMFGALGKLAALASKNTRMNWTPEEEQQLLPIVIELFDGAMELGSVTFQKAVRYVREFIASGIDQETADAIPFETLQGAYIHTARKFKDQGATTGKEVMGFDSLAELEKSGEQESPAEKGSITPLGTLSSTLLDAISQGNMPKDNPALKKLIEAFDGKPADQARMKEGQEQLEVAIVMAAREVVGKHEGDQSTYAALLRLYESQPNLNIRTSTSIANQAYSTPAPLAYLASQLAGITKSTVVREPTAGTGMLLIAANPAKAVVNELNDLRVALLQEQGFTPTQKDAATELPAHKGGPVDAVITNPPFGSIKDASDKPVKIKVDGYDIGQIDHLIAARALETMKDDGKAVLILGANKVAGGLSTDDRIFFNWLYGHYNVTGHFEVNGDLYSRQGAGWPVRVISIDGHQRSNTFSPIAGAIQRADNWSQVYEQYKKILDSGGQPVTGAGARTGSASNGQTGPGNLQQPAGAKAESPDRPVAPGGAVSAGNVAGAGTRSVPDSRKPAAKPVGHVFDEQRLNAESVEPDRLESAGPVGKPTGTGSAQPAGATTLEASSGNEFQSPYTPRSSRKDDGVLIPANMAQPTQDALSRLEDDVGDIDEFARKELGYDTVADLHNSLMGLQVDSVAMSIHQIKQGKAVVIADQTGIGKGRQAASIIRWAAKQGHTPVFVSVKPSLFTDMYGDLADIGTHDVSPFIMNGDAWVAGDGGAKLFGNKPSGHKATIQGIADSGSLPEGSNALFMTYSQINVANVQRQALMALAPNAVFVLDESHNAAGASATGEFMIGALDAAKGVTYLSATYAKRPDNMPLYFKTDIGDAAADTQGLAVAMASGGLPLQTVVSNNLVKAGQMFRRERSYDGVSIESKFDTPNRALHERMSNEATKALRAIVSADRMFHEIYVKQLADELAANGATVQDSAGNQLEAGVQHTEFSSVVHNFVKQMLLGLKAQTAADEAIASLKRDEKPIIAVENTMGSFLNEYAASNGIAQGDSLGTFDYRTVLTRALERSRVIIEVSPMGDKIKRAVPLSQLDAETRSAYEASQRVIDGLKLDIPVSPIDWIRAEITRAGYSVAEITGRNLSVDYTDMKKPVLSAIDPTEQKDKVNTTRLFNGGKLDSLILNVAGSTGISLHASEKFEDQRQRHMIVAQAAGDINIFMQMLGRVHRTGQVKLPKYTILSVDLPTEKRPTAVLSVKMKSLNANTSSNTESATSVKSSDILNKYGDQIVAQYLNDNYALARALGLEQDIGGDPQEDIARKATGRLALQPIETQHGFYDEVEGQYTALIDYLNKTNQNDLEPRTFDFDAKETRQETLFDGPNKSTPFGEDAIYGEYSIKAQGTPMKPDEIRSTMTEHLAGITPEAYTEKLLADLDEKFNAYYAKLEDAGKDGAAAVRNIGRSFLADHKIGSTYRVDINSEPFNAVVLNVRNSHKETGNPYSLSKIQVNVAVNGALRSLSVPATQFNKIEVSAIAPFFRIEQLFKEQPPNQRETAKIVTGNLLAAYGELQGVRGTIITFTKQDGTNEQGILLPKLFDYSKNTRGDYRLPTGESALKFLQESENKDIGKIGIMSRDGTVRVLPAAQGIRVQVPKSKLKGAKYFLDKGLISAGGDFVSSGGFMTSTVYDKSDAIKVLDLLNKKTALYALPSMADEAKLMTEMDAPALSRARPAFSRGAQAQATESVTKIVDAIKSRWANAPEIIVAFDMQDDIIPERIRQEDLKQRSGGAAGTPEGFYYAGKVYLMSSQLNTVNDVARVLFHESLGHFGLRGHFGGALKPILQQIVTFRRAEVDAKIKEYGLRSVSNLDRMTAAEEVLAEMAQNTPNLGFVKRAIAAIRNWLRANVPGFQSMTMTDADIVQQFILPARRFVEQGNTPTPSGPRGRTTTQPVFSRSMADTLNTAANNVRDVKLPAGYLVGDLINSVPGKLNWWHKTVGTQYNLAQRSAPFKRVFDSVQNFINDVSFFATEAADLAPNILPKLESWKDIAKSPLSPADTKAISAPIFEGTLSWARDESGKPVKLEVLEAAAAKLTVDQKSQRLLRGNHLSQGVLKMWRGLEQDQYEALINSKYESAMLKAGVVWSDAELKSMFGLTDQQIPLYREFRAATDKSLTNLAIADMLRFGGKDVEPIRDQVLASKNVTLAANTLADYLRSLTDLDPERAAVLTDTANKMIDKGDKAADLIKRGYAPLSRFGQYTLDVVHNGERVYFGMFENRFDAAKMNRQMQGEYPGATINQGTVSEQAYKMFAGVTPETLELFGDMLGLEATGDGAANEAFQTYLKLAKSSRSAMKRLIQRKGIAGFNEDAGRVLAGFVYSNARQTASSLHMGEMTKGATDKDAFKNQGELQDAAAKLVDYIKNPQEEAQAFRGLLFAQYIGGSIASAMVNVTQPLTMTFPWLAQFGGVTTAAKQMTAAVKDANKPKTGDAKLDAALHRAEEDGTVSPQEVHQLMQQAQGRGALQSGDGTTAGNAMATANNLLSRITLAWGKPFSWAEQFNRRVTFIAAYRTAVAQGMADPDGFARRAISETQGIYNKGNKPAWARGALGGVLFTFKQYSISYVEMLSRMAKSGPEGKKAALLALGVLFLLSGAGGMPGADDLDDLISGAMQSMGYNFDSKSKRQEFFVGLFGEGGAQFLERGVSGLPGVPIDVSGRMGLGNLLPGTGLFTKKVDHTRDVAEFAGPGGDLLKRGFDAAGKLITGDVGGAMNSIAPKAAQNLAQAFDMANMGMYRDAKGGKVLSTDGYDALAKAIGFQPNDVKRSQDASFDVQRMIGLNRINESEIANRWALGLFEKDQAKVQAARDDLAEWNRVNPESQIRIKFQQVAQRVKKMNETKAERIAKTAPKEIRNTVREELAAAR